MVRFFLRVKSIFKVAWGRTPVQWLWRKPEDELDTLLLIASKHYSPHWNSGFNVYIARVMYFAMLIFWPFRALLLIATGMRKYARKAKHLRSIGYRKQLYDQLIIAFRYNANPEIYYIFELFTKRRLGQARCFLLANITSALVSYVNNYKSTDETEDKLHYSQMLREHGLSSIKDIAVINRYGISALNSDTNSAYDLPPIDMIVKPNSGEQADGIIRLEWLGNGNYYCSNGNQYSKAEMHKYLQGLATNGQHIIQPRLFNHSGIADLTTKGFSTCRIITGITPTNDIEVVLAVFKMPTGESVVDNFSSGGIASPVNISTAELGVAVSMENIGIQYGRHPDTGAKITDRQLPFWPETLALVKSAHAITKGLVFLGWDVGITDDGPVILEANGRMGWSLAQRPSMQGLGSTRFSSICIQWDNSLRNKS